MVEGTRFRKLEETQKTQAIQINKLFENPHQALSQITNLTDTSASNSKQLTILTQQSNQTTQHLNDIQATITTLMGCLDQLLLTNPTTSRTQKHPPPPPPPPPPPFPQVVHPCPFELDFPRFDGTNPSGWPFKAHQFFDFHHTPSVQRIQIASFHMDDVALEWFQGMHQNQPFDTWDSFTTALETRFRDSPYTDYMGSLAKLQQASTVSTYISAYETLANRASNLSPEFLLSNFISGLKPLIRCEVQALQPTTLITAQALAKLQEEKLSDLPFVSTSPPTSFHTKTLPLSNTPSNPPPGVR